MGFIRVQGGCDVGIMIISARGTETAKTTRRELQGNQILQAFAKVGPPNLKHVNLNLRL